MPDPPPKETASVKRSSNPRIPSQNSDTEQQFPTGSEGKVPPVQPSEKGPAKKDENKVDGMNVQKSKLGTRAMVQEMEGTKTAGRSQTGKMAKKIKSADLHLSERNLRKIQPPSSVLQASVLLSLLMVKMKRKEHITPNRPPVLSPSLSPPWSVQEQSKPLSRQDKITSPPPGGGKNQGQVLIK
uniref:eukaryotic translation initiation factor 4B-like n=1 Tax=Macaca mulatta TaxID=9544 RepID=UPI0010A227FE|nr:eukaryotic translation initiation factor 4B-like [Macaca mulatta]